VSWMRSRCCLDGARAGVAAAETSHEGRLGGAGDGRLVVSASECHFEGCVGLFVLF